jgi:hypothetical protein
MSSSMKINPVKSTSRRASISGAVSISNSDKITVASAKNQERISMTKSKESFQFSDDEATANISNTESTPSDEASSTPMILHKMLNSPGYERWAKQIAKI